MRACCSFAQEAAIASTSASVVRRLAEIVIFFTQGSIDNSEDVVFDNVEETLQASERQVRD